MKKTIFSKSLIAGVLLAGSSVYALADTYVIDTKGSHASVNFSTAHLGFSILTGRFDSFSGEFNYDPAKVENSSVKVTVDTKSVDTNHAERDGHLRGEKFLSAEKFSAATFVSKKVVAGADKDSFDIVGDLELKGVTKTITIKAKKIGEGKDPWGSYRAGFSGTVDLTMADFGISAPPPATVVTLTLYVEGIKK